MCSCIPYVELTVHHSRPVFCYDHVGPGVNPQTSTHFTLLMTRFCAHIPVQQSLAVNMLFFFGMPTGVAVPAASSGFRFSSPYLRVMSASTLSCGTLVALASFDS